MKYYVAHNGVAAVYDERGDAIPFDTAAEASQHGDVVKFPADMISKTKPLRLRGRGVY